MPKSSDRLIQDTEVKSSVKAEFELFVKKMDYVRDLDVALKQCQYEVDPIITKPFISFLIHFIHKKTQAQGLGPFGFHS